MVKIAICNELFEGWDIGKIASYVAELGYDAVEIAPFTIAHSVDEVSAERRKEIRSVVEDRGIEVAGLHWLLLSPPGLYITHPEEEVRERTASYLISLVDFCADLGGKVMVIGSPRQRDLMEGVSYSDGWRFAEEVFRKAVKAAEDRGVILCLEPLHRSITNFITTASEAVRMIDAIGSPSFKLILDVYSMGGEEMPRDELIRTYSRYLAHVHINDDNKREPGSGSVDFGPIMRALSEIGYEGYVSVEVLDLGYDDPREIARRSIERIKAEMA
jgi:sugar phosphate isomerase/epimerase